MGATPTKPVVIFEEPLVMLGGEDVLEVAEWWRKHNIKAVVSACTAQHPDAHPPPRKIVQEFGLRVKHVNVPDAQHARLDAHFEELVDFMHACRSEGLALYVHCSSGISRSSTSMCAYLMAEHGLSFAQALGHVHRCRRTACPAQPFRVQLTEFEESTLLLTLRKRCAANPNRSYVERDLQFVIEGMRTFPDKYRQARYVYRIDGTPLPQQLEDKVVGCEIDKRKGYLKLDLPDHHEKKNFLVGPNFGSIAFEEQKRTLQERFEGLQGEAENNVNMNWLFKGSGARATKDKENQALHVQPSTNQPKLVLDHFSGLVAFKSTPSA